MWLISGSVITTKEFFVVETFKDFCNYLSGKLEQILIYLSTLVIGINK